MSTPMPTNDDVDLFDDSLLIPKRFKIRPLRTRDQSQSVQLSQTSLSSSYSGFSRPSRLSMSVCRTRFKNKQVSASQPVKQEDRKTYPPLFTSQATIPNGNIKTSAVGNRNNGCSSEAKLATGSWDITKHDSDDTVDQDYPSLLQDVLPGISLGTKLTNGTSVSPQAGTATFSETKLDRGSWDITESDSDDTVDQDSPSLLQDVLPAISLGTKLTNDTSVNPQGGISTSLQTKLNHGCWDISDNDSNDSTNRLSPSLLQDVSSGTGHNQSKAATYLDNSLTNQDTLVMKVDNNHNELTISPGKRKRSVSISSMTTIHCLTADSPTLDLVDNTFYRSDRNDEPCDGPISLRSISTHSRDSVFNDDLDNIKVGPIYSIGTISPDKLQHITNRQSDTDQESTKPTVKSSNLPCSCPLQSALDVHSVTVRVNAIEGADLSCPVRVNATCGEDGWEAFAVEAPPNNNVRDVKVQLCECSRQLTVDCNVVEPTSGVPTYRSTTTDLTRNQAEPKKPGKMVQMSILSYMRSGAGQRISAPASIDSGVTMLDPSAVERARRLERARQCQSSFLSRQRQLSSSSSSTSTSSSGTDSTSTKACPFYKKIPGTRFVVDAFSYGIISNVTCYFLSHFHSDHYIGLKRTFNKAIYCSSITAALVKLKIGVKPQYLNVIPLDTTVEIEGVQVTALDANHCPGSVMFLFRLPNKQNMLHVGDFRATPHMETYPTFCNLNIHTLFLDTTYCDHNYRFPPQDDMVASIADYAKRHTSQNPRTLIVCGTYLIGKEKVFLGIAKKLNVKIWADPAKRRVLRLLEDPEIIERLVDNPHHAVVHVGNMHQLSHAKLQTYLHQYSMTFTNILGIKPSGWQFSGSDSIKPSKRDKTTVVGVPYSEHSSFSELESFVKFLRPDKVVATVNVGRKESRDKQQRHIDRWLAESRRC